jgi:uncharacterized protein (DUF1800 family)
LTINRNIEAAIAVTRFGLGARPGEIDRSRADPRAFLAAQINPAGAEPTPAASATTAGRMADYLAYKADRAADKVAGEHKSDVSAAAKKALREDTNSDFLARMRLAATTSDGFRERWAQFWLNHFTVSAAKLDDAALMGPFENEAIRPRVFGRFEDLLVASSRHPAMLLYLDEARSIGPDSPAALAQSRAGKHSGLNENLAREILELHTVGIGAGYSQNDVTEFARALTGWTIGGQRDPEDDRGRFMFHDRTHEPGPRSIMGKRYSSGGEDQGLAILKDLAASPHTADHVATKVARHFVSDDPAPSLVSRLKQTYLRSGGDLADVARTLIYSPEAWDETARKFKTPDEFLTSAWRSLDSAPDDAHALIGALTFMGQKPFAPPSPKGWPEEAQVWCAPDAIIKRMNWSEGFAAQAIGDSDPRRLADNALGERLTPLVAEAIGRAETRAEGLSIMLMSPEFQRR